MGKTERGGRAGVGGCGGRRTRRKGTRQDKLEAGNKAENSEFKNAEERSTRGCWDAGVSRIAR